jgi:hypothetical protein
MSKQKKDSVFTMKRSELEARIARAKRLLSEIGTVLPGLVTMTQDERRHSEGKLRDGESDALHAVIEVAEAEPQYFVTLADKDGGVDPSTFETERLRDQLVRREMLREVVGAIDAVKLRLDDTVLALATQVRPVLLEAYRIAKPIAANDERMRRQLAPALDFYGRISRRGAVTRARKVRSAAS